MQNKNKSIFKELINTVSKLPKWVGAHVSVVKKNTQTNLHHQSVVKTPSDTLLNMSWQEFEPLIYEIFNQRGYSIAESHFEDEGIVDLVLQMNNETSFVQYKKWKEQLADVTAISDLYEVMKDEGARHGIVITSGVFTSEALDFSLGKALLLINGVDLSQMIEVLNSPGDENNQLSSSRAQEQKDALIETPEQDMPELEPLCPICSCKMVKRTAKKGKNSGNVFWGCSKFPACRGVISI